MSKETAAGGKFPAILRPDWIAGRICAKIRITERGAFQLEKTFAGYCRSQDGPRIVLLECEPGEQPEIDCDYASCIHAAACPIGRALREELDRQNGRTL